MIKSSKHEQTITCSTGDYLNIKFSSYAQDCDTVSLTDRETGDRVTIELAANQLQGHFIESISCLRYSRSEARQAFLNQVKSTIAEVEECYRKELEGVNK